MKRFSTAIAMLLAGLFVGIPTGFFVANRTVKEVKANPDALNLTLPKNYFADLPKAEDGDQRLINVDTFTFKPESVSGAAEETVVVVPRVASSELPNDER